MYSVNPINLAASDLVKSGPGAITTVLLTSGSDAATVILYDNTTGSGTVICALAVPAANTTVSASFPFPAVFAMGCYAAITGTGASVTICTL